ncbi:hypothetical protein Tco_1530623 [Tanacetum coccineum]
MEISCFVDEVYDSGFVQVQIMVRQVQSWKHVYASKVFRVRSELDVFENVFRKKRLTAENVDPLALVELITPVEGNKDGSKALACSTIPQRMSACSFDTFKLGGIVEVLCEKRAVDGSLDEDQWSLAIWAQDSIKEVYTDSGPMFAKPSKAEVVVGLESVLALQEKANNTLQPAGEITIFCRKSLIKFSEFTFQRVTLWTKGFIHQLMSSVKAEVTCHRICPHWVISSGSLTLLSESLRY